MLYKLTWSGWEPALDKRLIEYLDWYTFVWEFEIIWAIEDFYQKEIIWSASYSDLIYFQEVAKQYMQLKNLSFDDEKNEQ